MTRILLIETASPRRVRRKAEEILAGGSYTAPDITILCRPDASSVEHLSVLSGARIVPLETYARKDILRELGRAPFDLAIVFWTGEKEYRAMKRTAFRIKAREVLVEIGDGHRMKLTVGNFLRYLPIRWRHRQPTDHFEYLFETGPATEDPAAQDHNGERVLILQSAEPQVIIDALNRMIERPFFISPRFTIFCRNRLEIISCLRGHPLIHEIISHSETRSALANLIELRRRKFHGLVVFFTGDPSYWKIKYFTFMLGVPRKLIYNEFGGCFFFEWNHYYRHLAYRLRQHFGAGSSPRWLWQIRLPATIFLKLTLFPFRFLWLLGMWAWLRATALKTTD
jgi:hypothetical protein